MGITIYHNPRCSKSRASLALLEERGLKPEIVEYLKTPPDRETLTALLAALDMKPVELVRQGEQAWRDSGLDDAADDAAILALMLREPVVIERPIVISGTRAVIGRPPENVLALL